MKTLLQYGELCKVYQNEGKKLQSVKCSYCETRNIVAIADIVTHVKCRGCPHYLRLTNKEGEA